LDLLPEKNFKREPGKSIKYIYTTGPSPALQRELMNISHYSGIEWERKAGKKRAFDLLSKSPGEITCAAEISHTVYMKIYGIKMFLSF
jgi:hypothetical protein